ncbi:SepM family pheromone-processing serine protease [Metabacillus arenae]|uniref:endopeptidase La n=1 Tax=Metabacillus arenae TaxID=2771434 RepID=A0A926RVP6_9BACI|nr:SepM family pheromone-processing serine protease [Metabacillus arenae]MBD1379908.1 PDZ domain-containing protein [Metabacillus arenae]
MTRKKGQTNKLLKGLLLTVVLAILLSFIKLPFYVTKPGLATELGPIVEVEDGYNEQGSFSLTTVSFGRANIFSYAWAYVNKYHTIHPENEIKQAEESDDEYMMRQLHMMEASQEDAIALAYKKADKQVDLSYNGVYVLSIIEGMPASKQLKVGDRIYEVDGKPFTTSEEFIDVVSKKKEGDSVSIKFKRENEGSEVTLPVTDFPDNPDKVGIGIALVTDKEVKVEPDIKLDTNNIGGPSAGLMMSLEIYNQLIEKDLTSGYKIAGTGTITPDGKVGPIGGIEQKIVAADRAEVDIFFAPNEQGRDKSNYKMAVKTAEDIKTDMKIVPVDTFEDAVDYLEKVEKKS